MVLHPAALDAQADVNQLRTWLTPCPRDRGIASLLEEPGAEDRIRARPARYQLYLRYSYLNNPEVMTRFAEQLKNRLEIPFAKRLAPMRVSVGISKWKCRLRRNVFAT